jgi:hypothetical protein
VCKTESSEYGIFVSKGVPEFSVLLGSAYAQVAAPAPVQANQWHHVAGVFDGEQVRLYVNGRLAASKPAAGKRRTNPLPFIIGADVGPDATPNSFFAGAIDAVRLSASALYTGESFTPGRRPAPGDSTVLLTNMDATFAQGVWGEGPRRTFGRRHGLPTLQPVK